MDERLEALLQYVKSDGRVCPMPNNWDVLWKMLPNRRQKSSGGWEPALPLILAAWWDVSALSKMIRLAEHIQYAGDHGVLDQVDQYLRSLKPNQWAYGDGTQEWTDERRIGKHNS